MCKLHNSNPGNEIQNVICMDTQTFSGPTFPSLYCDAIFYILHINHSSSLWECKYTGFACCLALCCALNFVFPCEANDIGGRFTLEKYAELFSEMWHILSSITCQLINIMTKWQTISNMFNMLGTIEKKSWTIGPQAMNLNIHKLQLLLSATSQSVV